MIRINFIEKAIYEQITKAVKKSEEQCSLADMFKDLQDDRCLEQIMSGFESH